MHEQLSRIFNELLQSNTSNAYNTDFIMAVGQYVVQLLQRSKHWGAADVQNVDLILKISNILYNNTSKDVLLLDDGVYDQLLQAYKMYNPNYQVGSIPTKLIEVDNGQRSEKKQLYHLVNKDLIESKPYTPTIMQQHLPIQFSMPKQLCTLIREPITKRMINTEHKYPQLVGTLDKCKFTLNDEARQAGVFDDANVQIFERDFMHMCLGQHIIEPYEEFTMLGELKYDGVSVEAEVLGDRIITALSRGDTGANIATDLTPIFENYRFPCAKNVPKNEPFGIKFEAVLTHRNMEIVSEMRQREYKNGRNAIIGLLGASDAYRFAHYITLIPLATSIDWSKFGPEGRLAELEFLNTFYHSGELNRHVVFKGSYWDIMLQIKGFVDTAETIRGMLPYMIDGVVISFMDPNKIRTLGRVNSVNKWQMAIKFNPREVRTIFSHYTYSIGKSGNVIPMLHFRPVEFIGTIHSKQTAHSYQRFRELALVPGQEIDIKYVNDVLTYVTKPDTDHNRRLQMSQQPEPFIEFCPYCGSRIEISPTLKSARCPNPNCHERRIMRMVDMMDKLGFKDFSEETVRAMDAACMFSSTGFTSFMDLIESYNDTRLAEVIGPVMANKFVEYQVKLVRDPLPDYLVMAAMCFEGMGIEKWKLVLSIYSLNTLLGFSRDQLMVALKDVKGIGPATIEAIAEGFVGYHDELKFIAQMPNIVSSHGTSAKPKVVLTGFRDPKVIQSLQEMGYEASDTLQVTKDTKALIALDPNANSGKIQKAKKYGVPIISLADYFSGVLQAPNEG